VALKVLSLIAAALALALPAGASAHTYVVPARLPADPGFKAPGWMGPVLAGGKALWLETRGPAAVLVAAGEDGVAHELVAFPPLRGGEFRINRLFGGGSTVVVRRTLYDENEHTLADSLVRIDAATGATTPLTGCKEPEVMVGNVLLCENVLDLADGVSAALPAGTVAVGGRFAVVPSAPDTDRRRFSLLDWRAGTTVRELPDGDFFDELRDTAIGEDGTVAYQDRGGIAMLAPGAATPVHLQPQLPDLGGSLGDEPRLAGGRLAVRSILRGSFDDSAYLTVARTDGTEARTIEGGRLGGGWAFDGARLAWATRPCALTYAVVWDLAEPAPFPPSGVCSLPAIRTASLTPHGLAVAVKLRCPPRPARGCAGQFVADLYPRGGHRRITQTYLQSYELPAGTERVVRLRILRHNRLRGAGPLDARIDIENRTGANRARRRPLAR
jgi:hypothetical protein